MNVRRINWPYAPGGHTTGLAVRLGSLYVLFMREANPGLPTTFAVKAWLG